MRGDNVSLEIGFHAAQRWKRIKPLEIKLPVLLRLKGKHTKA